MSATVGQTGAAHPLLVLAAALEGAQPGEVIALVHLADGADVLVFRTTDAIARWSPCQRRWPTRSPPEPSSPTASSCRGATCSPPSRPVDPSRCGCPRRRRGEARSGSSASSDRRDRSTGAMHLPPARISMQGGAVDDMEPVSLAGTLGTVVTFTVDRIAYSPSPPIVFAIVDFDGGGRFPVELTDVDAETLKIGDRVEMTFRRLYSADGIHDYFWKARPVRTAGEAS